MYLAAAVCIGLKQISLLTCYLLIATPPLPHCLQCIVGSGSSEAPSLHLIISPNPLLLLLESGQLREKWRLWENHGSFSELVLS